MHWISMIGYYQRDLQFVEKLLHAKVYKPRNQKKLELQQLNKES